MSLDSQPVAATGTSTSARLLIALVALVCAAPFLAAWVTYYLLTPKGGASYGELLPTQPVPSLMLPSEDAEKLRGRWLLLVYVEGSCDARCEQTLYATRQAHAILGRDRARVKRVLLGGAQLSEAQRRAHPDLLITAAQPPTPALGQLLRTRTVLIDPLGNQVLAWPLDPDIKRLADDLRRLLRASRIG
ncbi:MAG: hypothetical protein N3F11_01500 [Casimicrobiaceae bacterium]|nr:hypothetical protein [Casimicrobiaceae bacterium]